MNWRRGLLLAGINLAVAVPLILLLESTDAAWFREREHYVQKIAPVETPPAVSGGTSSAKDDGVSFSPCSMTDIFSLREQIVINANLPAVFLTGWRNPCPANWTLSGMLHPNDWRSFMPSSLAVQRKVDAALLLLIALQWFLLGAFPIMGPRKWREPGMFITLCSALSVLLFFITPVQWFARLPALLASVTWFCWFALVIWRAIHSAWQWTARRLATNAT
jgi:hypothetical protein